MLSCGSEVLAEILRVTQVRHFLIPLAITVFNWEIFGSLFLYER